MPIYQWRKLIPDAVQFFDACDNFLRVRDVFNRGAAAYDKAIDEVIGPDEDYLVCPGIRVHAFLVASSMEPNLDDRYRRAVSGAPANMSENSLRQDANSLINDARVSDAKRQFEQAERGLSAAVSQLKEALGMQG